MGNLCVGKLNILSHWGGVMHKHNTFNLHGDVVEKRKQDHLRQVG
jgi:hypothetical protein